jgi:hypothetical protein
MITKCRVCRHPRVFEANEKITLGSVTLADLGKELGLSEMSVWRHKTKCLAKQVAKAVAKRSTEQGDKLLDKASRWTDIADNGLREMVASKDWRTIPGMMSSGLKAIETVARLECRPGFGDAVAPAPVVNIAIVRLPSMDAGGAVVATVETRPAPLLAGAGVTCEIVDAELVD